MIATHATANPLEAIPSSVQHNVRRALAEIARLSAEKQGYKRIGMGTRFDDDLDALMAPHHTLLAKFRAICARKGIDAEGAIALLRAPQ